MRAVCAAALLLLPAAQAAEPEPEPRQVVLHAFETVDRAHRPLGNGAGLRIALELNPARAALPSELVRRTGRKVGPDATLTVAAAPYAPSRDKVRPAHRRPSFVIDYDEPAFVPLREALRKAHGAHPTVAQLVAFTDRHIAKKNLSRGFDIASVVARRGEGDCTEHAVLLAALARASGYPARVVTGLALVQLDDGPQAFGHAWAELYVDGRWTLADAALTAPPTPLYLPLSVLAYEGMGLAPGLAPELGILDVRRVVVQAE